jgi:putative transposase
MKPHDLTNHHRVSTRLRGHDYASTGTYAVTICTCGHQHVFGYVNDGMTVLNETGDIAKCCWLQIPGHFIHVTLDAWVIMPNHIHGILIINQPAQIVDMEKGITAALAPKVAPLGTVIGSFKSAVSRLANERIGNSGSSFWQRNFYDRIIRDEFELETMRRYIRLNPVQWAQDPENIELALGGSQEKTNPS